MECCAFAIFTFEPDLTALHFNQAAGNIQPQSRAGYFASLWVIRPEEFLEDFLLVLFIDSNAFIRDPYMNDSRSARRIPLVLDRFSRNLDLSTLGRVLVGVADQVHQYLSQA